MKSIKRTDKKNINSKYTQIKTIGFPPDIQNKRCTLFKMRKG